MATDKPRGSGARGTSKGTSAKRSAAGSKKKVTRKKPTAKKAAASKAPSKKTSARKTSSRKTGSGKTSSGKTGAQKAAPKSEAGPKKRAAKKKPAPVVKTPDEGASERLHKYLASTGAGSRRECETFIAQGRVTVNGKTVTKMGVKVDPETDVVTLDGEKVRAENRVYYLLNKPVGYICTNSDERGRPRATDLIRDEKRIYTVGRLDADSTGLVLLTNDGGIANIICHPRYRIEKRYHVHVRGDVTRTQVGQVEAGVWLAEGKSSPALVKPLGRNPKRGETILEMTLFEGRNREIRRVFAKVGLVVRRLQRTAIGPLLLGDLPAGAYRRLEREELVFVHEAEQMYLANQAAWDAELPAEEERRPRSRPRRIGTGSRPDRGSHPKSSGRGERPTTGGWGSQPFPKRGHRRSDPGASGGDRGGGSDRGPSGSGESGPKGHRRKRYPS